MDQFPTMKKHSFKCKVSAERTDWGQIINSLSVDRTVELIAFLMLERVGVIQYSENIFQSNHIVAYTEQRAGDSTRIFDNVTVDAIVNCIPGAAQTHSIVSF